MTHRTRIVIAVVTAAVVLGGLVAGLITSRSRRTEPAAPVPSTSTTASVPTNGETMNLAVHFHRGTPKDPREIVAVPRSVPKTAAIATAALNELLPGPTAAEQADGFWSMFVPATARSLESVRIADSVAYVDFLEFRSIIPNASSSFGSAALLAEFDTTLRLFDGPFRRTGNGLAELTCYPASPNDGRPATTLPTVVSLQRQGGAGESPSRSRTAAMAGCCSRRSRPRTVTSSSRRYG